MLGKSYVELVREIACVRTTTSNYMVVVYVEPLQLYVQGLRRCFCLAEKCSDKKMENVKDRRVHDFPDDDERRNRQKSFLASVSTICEV